MKRMLYSYIYLILGIHAFSFSCENDEKREYYILTEPPIVEWEGHLWIPELLIHSQECPCNGYDEDELIDLTIILP
jgi:hypothetical protein